ncbi:MULTISPECIES: P450-derived glycosyltransferase activator [Streptomyces]|uniref:Cytochrome P450 n=1 Tax=Streptomyces luteosporeus TaxID=173856 RepID=A0ABP6GDN5_9ACTN
MLTEQTNSELGRHLLTIRGVQFIFGAQGDPFALLLRAGDDDPLAHGERARELGLHRSSIGAWVTASREVGARILGDHRFSARHEGQGPQHHPGVDVWENPQLCHVVPLDDAFLNLDPAEYDRLAAVAAPLLGTEAVESRRGEAEKAHREVLEGVGDEFDLYHDFAVPAVTRSVADLLGIPDDRRALLSRLHTDLAPALDAGNCPQQLPVTRALLSAVGELRAELESLTRSGAAAGLAGLPRPDAVAAGVLAVVVGIEASATALCNAVETLLDHPAHWERLHRDPGLVDATAHECLRFAPPLHFESRIAREETELAGQTIEAGARVVVLLDAANRDPEAFTDPGTFDPHRTDGARQLSLPGGPADAVTGALVRSQMRAALVALAGARPGLRRTDRVLRRMRSAQLRGVLRFPVA